MKGDYLEACNITACDTHKPAVYYNHSTRKYYCKSCAMRLNTDPYNHRDAMRMFGHTLCTLETELSKEFKRYMLSDDVIWQANGLYIEQLSQYKIEFTKEELFLFWLKEYYEPDNKEKFHL